VNCVTAASLAGPFLREERCAAAARTEAIDQGTHRRVVPRIPIATNVVTGDYLYEGRRQTAGLVVTRG
jgi:hypothetical protein